MVLPDWRSLISGAFHRSRRVLPAAVVFLLVSRAAVAQESAAATLSADLGSLAKLTFSTNSIQFPDADPDGVPQVPSVPAAIVITAKARAAALGQVTLTVSATDDLRAGIATIPATEITWNASGPGFVKGRLSRQSPQLVASWSGSGVRSGSQQFLFANRWSHPVGTYSLTLTYTLTAP